MLYRLVVNSPVYGQLEVAGYSIGRPDKCMKNMNVRTWAIDLYLLVYISMLAAHQQIVQSLLSLKTSPLLFCLNVCFRQVGTNVKLRVNTIKYLYIYILRRF